MNPISPENALNLLNEHLKKIEELLKKKYHEGYDEKKLLNTRIKGFIRSVFVDDTKKLADYENDLNGFFIASTGFKESGASKQKRYLRELKTMQNHLLAYADEIQLIITSESENKKDLKKTDSKQTNIILGNVGALSGRDINYDINASLYLTAIEKAIEQSENIPQKEKEDIVNKLKNLAGNAYVAGVSSGLITEYLTKLLGFGK